RLTLDRDGAALDAALPFRANRLVIEASATGPDNQFISGRSPVIVHPGPYYIGLSPQKYVSQAGEESAVDVVVVDWTGERLPETAVTVEFYRREWLNTFIANELGGGYWDWDTKDTLLNTVTVTTNELGEAVAAFIPPKGGSYHIVAAPAEPIAAEKNIRSSIFIWVAGKEYVSWRRENNDRITLVSDKTAYRAGDTAEILIPSPFKGPHVALVTVERAGVLRHDVIRMESNSRIYRLPITGGDIPNIYVSVTLVKGRSATEPADFKMGLLPFDVALQPKTLTITVDADTAQAQPGDDVTYTLTAANPDGTPAAGAELSFDVVDKAVLSLQPRAADILSAFYARRALEVNTAAGLSVSANRYLQQLAEDLDLETAAAEEPVFDAAGGEGAVFEAETAVQATGAPAPAAAKEARAANVSPPAGVDIRQEFADTAFWNARLITDEQGQAAVTVTLPDNLTTWTARGVGFTAATAAGEATADVVATKPLLVRPVTPRFFVVDDRARLAANVNNNTGQDLEVEVSLSAEGVGVSADTPPRQTVTIPAHGEAKVTWNVTVDDVVSATLVFAAVSGDYADAAKPRLTTGPDGSLRVFRYTAPDIVGTAGQLTEGGSRAEAVALPPEFDARRGQLTVQLDPSLAAGMQDGLKYLEHFEYECTEQTVSRFLPNVLTFNALQSLGIENPELAARLPGLVDAGLNKLYLQQNPDGGWGWWYRPDNWDSNPHVSGYVVFALLKAEQTGVDVSDTVLANGLNYLQNWIKPARDFKNFRDANRQAWLLYVLAEGNAAPPETLTELFDNRAKLSYYARAYLAQALWLADKTDSRLPALLSDLNNAAILSATGAHWEEHTYDWWAMNTDTRTTAIVLDTLAKLDPGNALIPNAVRWLMVARTAGIWETTQETAWALIALTDWMVDTGELDADYQYTRLLNDAELAGGAASRDTIRDSQKVVIPIADLVAGAANALTIARSDGNGRLYYTAHLEVHLPVEQIEPADRGISVSRRYTLASCTPGPACPEVREAKLGDVIRVDLTLIAPNDLYYLVLEDPLPAGGEAIDTGLATTSLLALDPALRRQDSPYWWWWRWYSRSELRDEKVVLFADYLSKGTYEYSYTFRATLPGDYHVIPAVAREFYFPEVFGRSDGRLLSIGR
ncbi:MAG: alpha-2-macroglobulin, partial [Anaerolineae bacterium]